MTEWLFAPSLWTILLLLVLGGVVAFIGNRRLDKKLQNIGLLVAGMGLLVAVLDYFVETPLEQTTRLTYEFVDSVVAKDKAKLTAILSPRASLNIGSLPPMYVNGNEIAAAADSAANQYGLSKAKITGLNPTQTPNLITQGFVVWSTQNPQPMRSEWTFEYDKIGDQWLLSRITCNKVGDMSLDKISQFMPSLPRINR